MSSPLGVDQELLLSYSQNDTKNFNATIAIGGSEGYEFTVISIATSVLLGVMTLTTIIGNIFVIAAIVLERNLQSVANYLILSLGVADLLVAVLVMPLGAVYEVRQTLKYDLRPTFLLT